MLCSYISRRGAVYWWRRRCRCTDGNHLIAISLAERHPAAARRLGLALSMESERMMGMHTKNVLTQALRDARDLYPHMIDRRAEEDIDAALCAKLSFGELKVRYQNARIYAVLNELAVEHGPSYSDFAAKYMDGQACRIHQLTAMLQENWELDHVECEKVAHRIERGYLREVYRPGSTIAGVPTLDVIEEQVNVVGLPLIEATAAIVCRQVAKMQAEFLWAAAAKYETFLPKKGGVSGATILNFAIRAPKVVFSSHSPLATHPFCDDDFEMAFREPDSVAPEAAGPQPAQEPSNSSNIATELPPKDGGGLTGADNEAPTNADIRGIEQPVCAPVAHPTENKVKSATGVSAMLLDTLVNDLIAVKANKWRSDSQQQHRSVAGLFARHCGDKTVLGLTLANIESYFAMLSELPPNYNKRPSDAQLDLPSLIAQAKDRGLDLGLSAATINRHVTQLSAIVGYAQDLGLVPRTELAWDRFRQQDERADDDKRAAFSVDEVLSILKHPTWTRVGYDAPWSAYWIPLLAAYTGARMGEIASLRVQDVDRVGELIDICPTPDRKLKTKESVRKLPLHQELKRLGFFDYVDAVRQAFGQESIVFVDLGSVSSHKTHADRFQKKWLKILNETISDAKSKDLCFHSFRHYIIQNLAAKSISDSLCVRFTGHKATGVSSSNYSFSRKKPPTGVYTGLLAALPIVSGHIPPVDWAIKVEKATKAAANLPSQLRVRSVTRPPTRR